MSIIKVRGSHWEKENTPKDYLWADDPSCDGGWGGGLCSIVPLPPQTPGCQRSSQQQSHRGFLGVSPESLTQPYSLTVLWPYKIRVWKGTSPRVRGRRPRGVTWSSFHPRFHPPSSPSAPSPGNRWCREVPAPPGLSPFARVRVTDIFSELPCYSSWKAKQKK